MGKTIDFSFTGGFPGDQQMLDKMQQSYVEFFKSIIAYIGLPDTGNFILSGVNVTETDISAGWVYMDGDIIPFAALTETTGLTTKFKKQTTADNLNFYNGVDRPVYITTAIIIDATGVELSTFTRVKEIPILPNGLVIDPAFGTEPPEPTVLERLTALENKPERVPIGLVAIWGLPEDEIPAGWVEHLALAGKFPLGKDIGDADFNSSVGITATGGNKTAVLDLENIPPHDHNVRDTGDPGFDPQGGFSADDNTRIGGIKTEKAGGLPDGSTKPVSILGPYRIVEFIRYVG